MPKKFIVRQLPGKGMGVVAATPIQPGELIIAEKPLIIVPWWVRHAKYPRRELRDFLDRCLDNLSGPECAAFYELSDCKCDGDTDDDKTQVGIWRTNNFALGRSCPRTNNGLFLEIARFNHSCVPSAEFHWNEAARLQEVRAVRNISPGEEITLCYVTSQTLSQPQRDRRAYLQEKYGFECMCSDCSLKGSAAEENDRLRKRVSEITSDIESLLYIEEDSDSVQSDASQDFLDAQELALERFQLMTQLGFKVLSRIDACQIALDLARENCSKNVEKDLLTAGLILNRILYGPLSKNYHNWEKQIIANTSRYTLPVLTETS